MGGSGSPGNDPLATPPVDLQQDDQSDSDRIDICRDFDFKMITLADVVLTTLLCVIMFVILVLTVPHMDID